MTNSKAVQDSLEPAMSDGEVNIILDQILALEAEIDSLYAEIDSMGAFISTVSRKEAARRLNCDPSYVSLLVRSGALRAYHVHNIVRILSEDVDRLAK